MTGKNLIVRISEGLGNQMFMYANAYALSKYYNFNLLLDDTSGYFKKKDVRTYLLNNFDLSAKIVSKNFKFDNYFKNLKRKFLKSIDNLTLKKRFIIEPRDNHKVTKYERINCKNLSNLVYIEGHYESEKYFKQHRNNLINEFSLKNITELQKNKYYNFIHKNRENIISICIRTNRFSERIGNKFRPDSILMSDNFTKKNIAYIKRAIQNLPININNPIYLVWSNNFDGLKNYFPDKNFIFVENCENKAITDFYLLTLCKYFIVGPTSFHWWGAWISNFDNKICIKPKDLNPSNNLDFWPSSWIPL